MGCCNSQAAGPTFNPVGSPGQAGPDARLTELREKLAAPGTDWRVRIFTMGEDWTKLEAPVEVRIAANNTTLHCECPYRNNADDFVALNVGSNNPRDSKKKGSGGDDDELELDCAVAGPDGQALGKGASVRLEGGMEKFAADGHTEDLEKAYANHMVTVPLKFVGGLSGVLRFPLVLVAKKKVRLIQYLLRGCGIGLINCGAVTV